MNTPFYLLSLMLFTLLALTSCNKLECDNCIEANLRDYHGLDGCEWIIELKNGERLEPTNLDAFDIQLANGKKICLRYAERHDLMSICMVGKTVDILELNCVLPGN